MFHVKRWWGRFVGWAFGLVTPDPTVKLPGIVLPPGDDDVPRET